jgi:hypothetical protein
MRINSHNFRFKTATAKEIRKKVFGIESCDKARHSSMGQSGVSARVESN